MCLALVANDLTYTKIKRPGGRKPLRKAAPDTGPVSLPMRVAVLKSALMDGGCLLEILDGEIAGFRVHEAVEAVNDFTGVVLD